MSLSDFSKIEPRIRSLQQHWSQELLETDRRRMVRNSNDSVVELRHKGVLAEDQTWIPRRIADTNIRREQPGRINYISQSRDLAKFRALSKLTLPIEPLEREFTEHGQYPGWQLPLYQAVDGASTHGWDAVEILFDKDRPGHFFNRHIGHEYLWFAPDVADIQEAPLVAVIYGATLPQLEEYAESYGFEKAQVAEVEKVLHTQEDKADSKVQLVKVYYKEKGFVWVGWHCEYCRDWLKKPAKLYLGIIENGVMQHERQYPIKILRYDISENEMITDIKGRVFRDEHDQEAVTQSTSALVNRLIRSTKILFAQDDFEGGQGQAQTQIKIKDGAVMPKGAFFNIDPPDPGLFSAILHLLSLNSNEANQVNFTAMNRKDSRKTAEEIKASTGQQAQMSAVDVMLLSLFLQDVYSTNWRIFRSQVLQGKIQSALPNWKHYYEGRYLLMPSGDSDVIRRQEINQAMKQDWPVIQNTGAAEVFLADLLRASPYAENAQKYIDAMAAANRKDNLLLGLKNAILALAVGPDGKPTPQAQLHGKALKELEAEFAAVMNPEGEQPSEEPANAEPQEAAA